MRCGPMGYVSRMKDESIDLIPDFCQWRPLLALAAILELIVVVLTLAKGLGPDVLQRFVTTSIFLQWTGLCSAAVLCGSRRALRQAPVGVLFFVSWTLLVVVLGVVSAAAYQILQMMDLRF